MEKSARKEWINNLVILLIGIIGMSLLSAFIYLATIPFQIKANLSSGLGTWMASAVAVVSGYCLMFYKSFVFKEENIKSVIFKSIFISIFTIVYTRVNIFIGNSFIYNENPMNNYDFILEFFGLSAFFIILKLTNLYKKQLSQGL